jgi:hypothetical protein
MSAGAQDRLYRLLPAVYRQRDEAEGGPLRALLGAMEEELRALEADVGQLYDNWFIETCEEWIVPYLGDLLGVRGLNDEQHLAFSQRGRVAGALGFRRRKGTVAALQDTAWESSGWRARAVEFFDLVCATQHVAHRRPGKGTTVDLRHRAALERAGGPFDAVPRSVDVRGIAAGRGRHNLPNVGVFVCRLQSYPLTHRARAVADPPDGRYTFDPLGRDLPLFNRPQTRAAAAVSAAEAELPLPVRRAVFAEDLATFRIQHGATPPDQRPPATAYYGPGRALAVFRDGVAVPPFEMSSADLGEWARSAAGVAVDVERGRLMFATAPAREVTVTYNIGFAADLGGGPYDRRASLQPAGEDIWVGRVTSGAAESSPGAGLPVFPDLAAAVTAWTTSARPGLIEIQDSESYELAELRLPAGRTLAIQAADGMRPALVDPVLSIAAAGDGPGPGGRTSLVINGVLLGGEIRISGDLDLALLHCTVPGGLAGAGHRHELNVQAGFSLLGPLLFPKSGVAVTVRDSVLGGRIEAGTLDLERTTVLGEVAVEEVGLVSESILAAPLVVARRHSGALRFSAVAPGSATPPRFRCQPDLALAGAAAEDSVRILRRVVPDFTSRRPGDAGYAQLSPRCAPEISAGAEDGSEMGAFHHLHQPQRAANLAANLDEYLPLGLEAGVFYVT